MRTIKMIDSNFIRVSELATYLNISKVTVWRWRKEGRLPAARAISPKIVGWKRETIERWLEEQTTELPY
ncbi:helix-turn-helix domain-containing protein [Vibrio sp. Vb1574]|uniref:helix-turn-helix transcriptional regulator n=2 Tax=Vibrionaceae TaxID=641 RepID=UPI002963ED95|nr:helix-turn-helix domain-containing protein [Vibrio sp. Vb1574]MDW1889579.1 helix-turn-helix domain-containing protein [Vibrio sp. Vb1574]